MCTHSLGGQSLPSTLRQGLLLFAAAYNILAGSRASREPRHGWLYLAFPGYQDSNSDSHACVAGAEHWAAPWLILCFQSCLQTGMPVLLQSHERFGSEETTSSQTQGWHRFYFFITTGHSLRTPFTSVYILPKYKNMTSSTTPSLCDIMLIFKGLKYLKCFCFQYPEASFKVQFWPSHNTCSSAPL